MLGLCWGIAHVLMHSPQPFQKTSERLKQSLLFRSLKRAKAASLLPLDQLKHSAETILSSLLNHTVAQTEQIWHKCIKILSFNLLAWDSLILSSNWQGIMKDVFVLSWLQKWLCLDFSIPMYLESSHHIWSKATPNKIYLYSLQTWSP